MANCPLVCEHTLSSSQVTTVTQLIGTKRKRSGGLALLEPNDQNVRRKPTPHVRGAPTRRAAPLSSGK